MRALTKNEKVLGGLFLLLGVGLLLLLLATSARRWIQRGQTEARDLRARLVEARQWIDEEPVWSARAEWLRANPLPAWQEDQSEAELIQKIQESLGREGITINSQRLLAASSQAGRHEIGVELSLKGTTTQIVRWLHTIQQPGEFIHIRQINLRADPDKTNLRADVSLVRYYGEGGETGTPAPSPSATPSATPPPSADEATPDPSPEPTAFPEPADSTAPVEEILLEPPASSKPAADFSKSLTPAAPSEGFATPGLESSNELSSQPALVPSELPADIPIDAPGPMPAEPRSTPTP